MELQTRLPPWQNVIPREGDPEVARIDALEERLRPVSRDARAIRNLITRLEICHFKLERHLERIVAAIGRMRLDVNPDAIGRAHPRFGENAWRDDATGRSRVGQEFIWILRMWLEDAALAKDDPRGISRERFEGVCRALGEREPRKARLVAALLGRLVLDDDRGQLTGDLAPFQEQTERMDICHYDFPGNLEAMIRAIGSLKPVPASEFTGCGSCGAFQREKARSWFRALTAWLRGEPGPLAERLGDRSAVKEWLVASLAKTLKEHAALAEALPAIATGPEERPWG